MCRRRTDIPRADRACPPSDVRRRRKGVMLPREHSQCNGQRHGRDRKQILPCDGRIDRPSRIHEIEAGRPEQRAEIEPDDAAGEQQPLEEREREAGASRADDVVLEPDRERAGEGGDREPGNERQHVAPPVDAAALPPSDDEQRGRQRCSHGLREQRADEEGECNPVLGGPEGLCRQEGPAKAGHYR